MRTETWEKRPWLGKVVDSYQPQEGETQSQALYRVVQRELPYMDRVCKESARVEPGACDWACLRRPWLGLTPRPAQPSRCCCPPRR